MLLNRLVALALGLALDLGCAGETTQPRPVAASGDGASDAAMERPDVTSNGESGADAGVPCDISASNYDQSCRVDTDCARVASANYCKQGPICDNSTINVGALMQFNADVARTPIGSGALMNPAYPCQEPLAPCCRRGACTFDCWSSGDTLPACADAGGRCDLVVPGPSCKVVGPPGSCAYADEVCCGG